MNETVFGIGMSLWIVFGVTYWIYLWKATAVTKRRLHVRLNVLMGIYFGGLLLVALPRQAWPIGPLIFLPALFLIVVLNIKLTRFCSACNATLVARTPWTPPNFCSKCGAALDS